jgi:hypothetical protein
MANTTVFRAFEREAIARLCGRTLEAVDLESVLDQAAFIDFDHTGVGYFLTVRHHAVPTARTVCSEPLLVGRACDVEVSFVVFIEDQLLTLECHEVAGDPVPVNIRDLPFIITDAADSRSASFS